MTGAVVLDTNIASFVVRRDSRLDRYRVHYDGQVVVLPFQVVAELRFGVRLAQWGPRRRADLERFISGCVVAPYSDGLASVWAELMLHAQGIGRRLEAGDAWIAATALHLGRPLLTHDTDFTRLAYPGLTVVCFA